MHWWIPLLGMACTPHLVSNFEEITGENWAAPVNGWGIATPPTALVGEGFAVGQVPHDFRMMDQNGQDVALWQFYGSVIVLDISTMWCAPCQKIAQDVNDTYLDYRDEGFMYLTMLPEDNDGNVPDKGDLNYWADSFGIVDTPVLQDGQGYGYAVEPGAAWPAVMLIDRDMRVRVERLSPDDEVIRTAIEALL